MKFEGTVKDSLKQKEFMIYLMECFVKVFLLCLLAVIYNMSTLSLHQKSNFPPSVTMSDFSEAAVGCGGSKSLTQIKVLSGEAHGWNSDGRQAALQLLKGIR